VIYILKITGSSCHKIAISRCLVNAISDVNKQINSDLNEWHPCWLFKIKNAMNVTLPIKAWHVDPTRQPLTQTVPKPPKQPALLPEQLFAAHFEPLFDMIRAVSALSNKEMALISNTFRAVTLKRKECLLRAGDQCEEIWFIVKGSLRMYALSNKLQEQLLGFGWEHCWMTDYGSLTLQRPSDNFIETLERTKLLVLDAGKLKMLMERIPGLAKVIDQHKQQNLVALEKRIYASLGLSAEQRYLEMMQTDPHLIARFPQMMIASYLGITAETLSKLRNKLARRR
jgi:CRP-like cAMP-binding protein